MNKKLVLSLMLATGLAFAQSGSSSGSQSSSTPSTQPSQQTPSQQPSTSSSDQSSQTSTSSSNSQDTVVRGCLKQSGGNWMLSSNGQNITLNGDDSTLKPHDGHQVEVHGTRGSDLVADREIGEHDFRYVQHEPGFVWNAGRNQRSSGRRQFGEPEQCVLHQSEFQLHAQFRHEQPECGSGSEQLCKFSEQRQLYSKRRSSEFKREQSERGRPNSDTEQQHELSNF